MANALSSLEDVRETLIRARNNATPCALLIGEGCSVTAGIPTPEEFVFLIRRAYPEAYHRAREKTFATCLSALSPLERRRLIGHYLDKAQVNPAHLAIGHLVREGYVDRILTTNFDPLILRACALLGEFPAVYDLTASGTLESLPLPDKAVIFLKGQRTRLVHRPSPDGLASVLRERRDWLVVGYDGLYDPIFESLSTLPTPGHRLFWVRQVGAELPEHLHNRIPATFLSGYSPDSFLVTLVRQLGDGAEDFTQEFLEHPHANLEALDVSTAARQPRPKYTETSGAPSEMRVADRLAERAQIKANQEADALFEEAYARYGEAALRVPGQVDLYVHWGNALTEQAKLKTGAEAERLLAHACQKYCRAASLSPQEAQTEYLWGLALSRRAQLTRGDTSEQLLRDAMVHLSNAEERNPGSAAYVLACLCGARGDAHQVRLWLTRGKVSGTLPVRSTVESASALKAYTSEPWFATLFGG